MIELSYLFNYVLGLLLATISDNKGYLKALLALQVFDLEQLMRATQQWPHFNMHIFADLYSLLILRERATNTREET